jgi:hypothetical protein
MLEFPVNVSKTDGDEYIARMADLPEGPIGKGVDPYDALNDLERHAQPALTALRDSGDLPQPSPIEDRPTISFDQLIDYQTHLISGNGQKIQMLGYSWTNHVIFPEH